MAERTYTDVDLVIRLLSKWNSVDKVAVKPPGFSSIKGRTVFYNT